MAGACAVHCLAAPAMVALFPLLGVGLVSARAEWLLMMLSVSTSARVLVRGCFRTHGQKRALIPFAIGAGALVAIRLTGDPRGPLGGLSLAGATVLVLAAHILNLRLCRQTQDGGEPASINCSESRRPQPGHR